jgi:hypothetical protein
LHCLGAEMFLRCRQRFPGKERCLLVHLSPFGTSCSPFFSPSVGSCFHEPFVFVSHYGCLSENTAPNFISVPFT